MLRHADVWCCTCGAAHVGLTCGAAHVQQQRLSTCHGMIVPKLKISLVHVCLYDRTDAAACIAAYLRR